MNRNAVDPTASVDSQPTYEGRRLADPLEPIFDQGLAFDLETLIDRRRALQFMGLGGVGAGIFALIGCSPAGSSASALLSSSASASAAAAATASAGEVSCEAAIPEETAGPFPGDGSNGPDVLTESAIVRSDIRTNFGAMSGTAEGIPLTIRLALLDLANGCTPLAQAAVYVWHCDRAGGYSLYSPGVTDQNYLRGVQAAGDDGIVTFQSIFPACYQGRWPHIHFEVYPSLEAATSQGNRIATSQVALPEDVCRQVYVTAGYEQSISNMQRVSLQQDNVFGEDGGARQLGIMSGSLGAGLSVYLGVPVSA
jgi:protocatechuate 3,4-dioxygenase beta subunit